MKKLLLLPLALAVLLTGCAGRGDKEPEESAAAAHQVAPLTLSEEEGALLDLIAGTDGEYGLYACSMGEDLTGCTIEVLSWSDGAWQTLAEGGLSSSTSEELRLGIVLSGSKITVNFQDGGSKYSYAPQVEGMDRSLETGRSWVWMDAPQELVPGQRVPLYLEVYDSGSGIRSAALPDTFTDAGQLNSYDRAYAVALTPAG
ncbi:hypothetical protein [uncultured Flavonifractor sp.]|uniref:hypothetical protein n=1 Tax=uncultured Flavonifractor sp. TaxID=1193534 RepID=UPI002604066E|nr:hypothetical protein [uncultured Flavonifractor sp.]